MGDVTAQPNPHDTPPGVDGIARYYGWDQVPAVDPVQGNKAALKAEFGERWSIIHTDQGNWWALRRPRLDRHGRPSGHRVTELEAGTAEELRAKLADLTKDDPR